MPESVCVSAGCRVVVCVRGVYSDERARCWVWAERARPVRWLCARLGASLGLDARRMRLLCRGHLLLPDEPLALLQHDDVIQVVMKDHIIDPPTALSEEYYTKKHAPCETVECEIKQKQNAINNSTNIEKTRTEEILAKNKQQALALLAHFEQNQNSTIHETDTDTDCVDNCAQSLDGSTALRPPSPPGPLSPPSLANGAHDDVTADPTPHSHDTDTTTQGGGALHQVRKRRRVRRRRAPSPCAVGGEGAGAAGQGGGVRPARVVRALSPAHS